MSAIDEWIDGMTGGKPSGAQRRALDQLTSTMGDSEIPLALAYGNAEDRKGKGATVGVLLLTDRRLRYQGSLMGTKQDIEFRLGDIDSVVAESGLLLGSIIVTVAGNGFRVGKVDKAGAKLFVERTRQEVDSVRSRSSPSPGTGSNVDDLMKLAALRESGVLSIDEFEAAKARILGSI